MKITPSSAVYPGDVLTYNLTSTGAKSCRLTSVREPIAGTLYKVTKTYLSSADNKTTFTDTRVHTPGKYTFNAKCFSELDGRGAKKEVTKTVTVACVSGTTWNGSSCVIGTTNTLLPQRRIYPSPLMMVREELQPVRLPARPLMKSVAFSLGSLIVQSQLGGPLKMLLMQF